jgi:hypothetical protein
MVARMLMWLIKDPVDDLLGAHRRRPLSFAKTASTRLTTADALATGQGTFRRL